MVTGICRPTAAADAHRDTDNDCADDRNARGSDQEVPPTPETPGLPDDELFSRSRTLAGRSR